jgi:hypothetical protein
MSEIEKLYENAGVLKECLSPCYINKTWRKAHNCPNCDNRESYPPFTAEKQLELIKWCLDNYRGYVFDSIETEWFEEQLCAFINNIWQDLTAEEKQQVKGILE